MAAGRRRLDGNGTDLTHRYNIDLGAHLAECDGNYHRLCRLLPDLDVPTPDDVAISFASPAPAVVLRVLDQCRYTTVVSVRQGALGPAVADTRIKVRLYHDARCAEVIEFQGQRHFASRYDYPNALMRQPDEKVRINHFLRELLSLCLRHGVAREPATADTADTADT